MFAKDKSPELDKCPPLNLSGIASNIAENVDKEKAEEEERGKEMRWILDVSTRSLSLHSFSLHPCCCRCPELSDPSAFALVRRLEGTKRKLLR